MDWKEKSKYCWSATVNEGREEMTEGKDIQKGAWTEEEDSKLVEYIKNHGEHHWDFVARSTGLKRTGKSCRLRWLNYLRPGIRRGNFTLEEQLKILELYSFWGNRWSKIAESLHGRTDNEIKNFWRTRVRRQAKQLNCEVNSKEFRDIICYVLIPRLAEQVRSKSWEYNNSSISPAVLIASPVPSSGSSSSNDLFMADRNDKASKDCNSLIKNSPFQHDMDQFPTTAADNQFGEDIWNDENVNFLQQLLFGDNYCDI